jgi:hypothetical protein
MTIDEAVIWRRRRHHRLLAQHPRLVTRRLHHHHPLIILLIILNSILICIIVIRVRRLDLDREVAPDRQQANIIISLAAAAADTNIVPALFRRLIIDRSRRPRHRHHQ